jgi:hypothetical protein
MPRRPSLSPYISRMSCCSFGNVIGMPKPQGERSEP